MSISPINVNLGPSTPEQTEAQALAWMNAPVPRMYTNGFLVAQTAADFTVVMLLNGGATAIVNMSFVGAKTLVEELGKAVNNLETGLEQRIPSMEEVVEKMKMLQGKASETK